MAGLPPGSFELPIFETILFRHTIRGSIVGTRKDMQEDGGEENNSLNIDALRVTVKRISESFKESEYWRWWLIGQRAGAGTLESQV